MSAKAEIIGLRLKCPVLSKVVTVARDDYAIGPKKLWPHNYIIRCKCGAVHEVPMKFTERPDKTGAV